jgi:hypothetical protein
MKSNMFIYNIFTLRLANVHIYSSGCKFLLKLFQIRLIFVRDYIYNHLFSCNIQNSVYPSKKHHSLQKSRFINSF